MKVPLLDLSEQNGLLREEIAAAIERVVRSNAFIMGKEVASLEREVAAYSGAGHGIGVSSGTDALLVSLMALGIEAGDEVLTSPYTFFATAGSIARLGARPVFVDIDPAGFNIDPALVGDAVGPRTKAIMPVHLFGQCAEMEPLMEAAGRARIPVIEDAAQALGAEYRDGRRAGSMGSFGCLSFFPSKNLGGMGDSGMILCQDPELAERARAIRVHGEKRRYFHDCIGGNFRMDEIQAAVLSVKLKKLDEWTYARQRNAARYRELFEGMGLLSRGDLCLPAPLFAEEALPHFHVYNQYVVRARERDKLREFLSKKDIGTQIYYPLPLHLQECFRGLGYRKGSFPEAEKAAAETLALPIFPELSQAQQEHVAESIREFYRA